MIFNRKFDMVVSLGADCGCALYLKRFKLREFSYPFDWVRNASFENRIKLIKNHFEGYLVKENLKLLEKNSDAILRDDECDYYEDNKYGTQFLHDFISGIDFDSSFCSVKEKYDRRVERLYSNAEQSKSILFIWRSIDSCLPNDEIIEAYTTLAKVFSKSEVFLLIIENSNQDNISEDLLNSNIIKITANIVDLNATNPKLLARGNEKVNNYIFSQIKCKKAKFSLRAYFIKKYIKLFCLFIRPAKKRKLIIAYLNSQLLSIKD